MQRAGEVMAEGVDEAEEHAKQDRLLDEIEERGNLDWAWQPMLRTYALLRQECTGDLAWMPTRYLQSVRVRGQGMFNRRDAQLTLDDDAVDALTCRCGGTAPVDDDRNLGGRRVRSARCRVCGLHLTAFDDQPR